MSIVIVGGNHNRPPAVLDMSQSSDEKAVKKPDMWKQLMKLISNYREAAIAESWKGGGDPADVEVHEAYLKLTELQLSAHIEKMQRELT